MSITDNTTVDFSFEAKQTHASRHYRNLKEELIQIADTKSNDTHHQTQQLHILISTKRRRQKTPSNNIPVPPPSMTKYSQK